jgi:two-component system, OmpR family, sensor kinase
MSIRLKIIAFQVVVAFMLLSTAAATYFSIERIDYYFDRTRLSREQMDTVVRLSAHMNRYSENIAEMLLLGRTELDDFYDARVSLEDSLARLTELIEDEVEFVRTDGEREEEMVELNRTRTMRTLFESIDLTAQRLMFLRDQGRQEEAVELFREEIEDRLDEELELYISQAIADEEAEIEAIEMRTNQLEQQLILLVLGVCLAALAVSLAAGALLARTLTRPIEALTSGARAIGGGDLSYRITYDRRDEFSDLADQFNVTAASLEAQRQQLLEVQAGLESEVERRTSQLEDANGRLQRLDHMRILFLADIGHELRTPLTVLRGEAEVALRGERAVDEHRETLGRIVTLTQQMGRLVEDLLFLARAEVGAVRFEMQAIPLQDALEMALADARVLAESSDVLLHASLPDEPCRIEGDVERLTQAFLIVLDNAIKYSDPGETAELSLVCDGTEATVHVRSAGPAIPSSDLPFVFNRFYRGRQSNVRNTTGSGLGLSIAKWIVDTHGGQIALTSAARETTVSFRFPTYAARR